MKITNLKAFNFEGAFRGMRNPMNSWNKSDSIFSLACIIGPKDLELAQKLIRAGGEHRKFLRQIIVSFDLTAPLYFWKEFDTYKIGTVANSTSTMHKLASTPITLDCFETDDFQRNLIVSSGSSIDGEWEFTIEDYTEDIIDICEKIRQKYLETKDTRYWKELIRWLPESWLQTRTITMNYENILNIIHQRHNHKLSEWRWLVKQFQEQLPYANELLFFTLEDKNDN